MSTLLWVVLPYVVLLVFVLGHVWRWRYDQLGWSTHTSQVLESRLLRPRATGRPAPALMRA